MKKMAVQHVKVSGYVGFGKRFKVKLSINYMSIQITLNHACNLTSMIE